MDTRIALIGIILESRESVDELNHLLSEYGEYVIGRMGIPYAAGREHEDDLREKYMRADA